MAVVTYDFVGDFGAPVDGTTSACPALADWHVAAALDIANGDTPKLTMGGYTYTFPGVPNGLSQGLKRAIIDGEGATVDIIYIGGYDAHLDFQTFTNSARIATVAAGATSATVITGPYPNDVQTTAAFLSVDQWVMFCGISLMAGGYPQNFQYNEYRKLTGIAGNVITWAGPLVYEYKQTWPLCDVVPITVSAASPAVVTMAGHGFSANQEISFSFDVGGSMPSATPAITKGTSYYVIAAGLTANTFRFSDSPGGAARNTTSTGSSVLIHTRPFDQAGPATVFGLGVNFEGEHSYSNLTVTQSPGTSGGGSSSIILDNVDFTGNGPSVSAAKSWINRNSQVGSQNEIDKILEYVEYDNCTGHTLEQLSCQSPGCMEMLINDCTFRTLNGTPHNLTITNSSITYPDDEDDFGLMAGAAFFGRTKSITINNSSIASTRLAGARVALSDFTDWSFNEGVFSILLTNGTTKNEAHRCFVPGYKYIVGRGSGAGNTNPDVGDPVIFTVLDMYQDATTLYIETDLASASFPTYGGGGAAEFFYSYGAKTITQDVASGPADVTQFAEPYTDTPPPTGNRRTMLATRAKAHYRDNLHEPVEIRRITGTGSSRTDNRYATVGRVWKATRKDLVGGFAQQDMQAIIYAQALFDNGLPSDVIKGDFLIDQDGIEYSVEDVEFRRVEAVMIAYECKIRG